METPLTEGTEVRLRRWGWQPQPWTADLCKIKGSKYMITILIKLFWSITPTLKVQWEGQWLYHMVKELKSLEPLKTLRKCILPVSEALLHNVDKCMYECKSSCLYLPVCHCIECKCVLPVYLPVSTNIALDTVNTPWMWGQLYKASTSDNWSNENWVCLNGKWLEHTRVMCEVRSSTLPFAFLRLEIGVEEDREDM